MEDRIDIEAVVRSRLRTLRDALGLSLAELAARTNLSRPPSAGVETL